MSRTRSGPAGKAGPVHRRAATAQAEHDSRTVDYTGGLVAAFVAAMRGSGLAIIEPERIAANGEWCTFYLAGDNGKRHGWAKLLPDGRGWYGDYRDSTRHAWHAGAAVAIDPAAVAEAAADRARRVACEARERATARLRDAAVWQAATAADPRHPYLVAKGVKPHGIRQYGTALVVPMRDARGALCGLQYIGPPCRGLRRLAGHGNKRFSRLATPRGAWHLLGRVRDLLLVAEGYATAASLYERKSWPVAVAFSCGNLLAVACALRTKYPRAALYIAADNDSTTQGNPGMRAAFAAAAAVGGKVLVPPAGANDWNDYFCKVETV